MFLETFVYNTPFSKFKGRAAQEYILLGLLDPLRWGRKFGEEISILFCVKYHKRAHLKSVFVKYFILNT